MIQLRGVCKSFDGGKTFAVRDADLEVPGGVVLALLGGSGSGKSTTLRMINRLIEPTSGTILLGDEDVTGLDPVLLRRRIGYVFQGVGLFPHMSIARNVAVPLRLAGRSPGEIKGRVDELLALVDLPPEDYARRMPAQLSGGQRQRVGFARALAAEPRVMLLDEPFGALDPITRDALQSEFLALQKRLGFTAVLVTHDMAEALRLADVIAVMQSGRIVRCGGPIELLSDPGHEYVAELLDAPRRQAALLAELEAAAPHREAEGEG